MMTSKRKIMEKVMEIRLMQQKNWEKNNGQILSALYAECRKRITDAYAAKKNERDDHGRIIC